MSDITDPSKLKVVELRAELSARGLDTKGNKAALVDRLKEALERETGQSIADTSILDTSTEDSGVGTSVSKEKELIDDVKESVQTDADPEPQVLVKEEHDREPPPSQTPERLSETEINVKEEMPQMEQDPQVKIEKEPQNVTPVKEEALTVEKMEVKEEPVHEIKMENETVVERDDQKIENREDTRDRKERDERRPEKRRRSPSPRRRSPQRRSDDEPEYDETAVILSWYDSDLNLIIDKEKFCSATPMYEQGFGYIWAGARASYGFASGKVCFEVKLLENCDVSHLEDEPTPHVLRVGWSTVLTSMQLGEEPISFGYGGTGKASTDCNFKNYGKPFVVGDVVGAFLDMNSDPIIVSYYLNGEPQGVAYEIARSDLDGNALFPHVLTKNIKFECNFGDKEPWFPLIEGYTMVGQVAIEERVAGPRRPEKRGDCEMIMMCGLPGCGKTTWANEWYAKNLTKNYNILGTNNLIDKMKVMGLPRKRNYAGRWDLLIEKCTKCLIKLLDVASRRRRNYILDQTNVYPSAQRRKMRGFEGFVRRAVVIVPTDEEFKKRIEKREKVEGKDVPDSAVLEMKANFMLPETGDIFTEVIYTELNEEESRSLVQQYNKEGREAVFSNQHKRPRLDSRDRDRSSSFSRGGGCRPRGGPDRNRSGSWQPRGGGGWRDRPQQSCGFRSGGGGNSGGSWRGGRGARGNDNHSSRGFDRNRSGGNNRNPGSGGKGNWCGYNQGGGNWSGSGGNAGNSGGWGPQNYNQQGWGGQQGGYSQQGWKGYNQQTGGGGYGGQGYNQAYNQQGYGNGNTYPNWNQQYYNQSSYGTGTQGWNQGNTDGSYSNYSQQQGSWQGYGQGYNYGTGAGQQAQQGGGYSK